MRKPALPRTAPRALVVGLGVGAVLLAVLVAALVFLDRIVPDARREIAHDAEDEAAQLAEARSAILTREPDADSVTLGKVAIDWIGEAPAVCGRVDIEEPQDSLDGPERFVFIDGGLTLESQDGSAAVDAKWKDVCDDV